MATVDAIFNPTGEDLTGTVNSASSSAEIVIGKGRLFAITASGDFQMAIGTVGMAAAAATNFKIWAGVIARYDLGNANDRIRIYNPGGSTISYFIQYLSRS